MQKTKPPFAPTVTLPFFPEYISRRPKSEGTEWPEDPPRRTAGFLCDRFPLSGACGNNFNGRRRTAAIASAIRDRSRGRQRPTGESPCGSDRQACADRCKTPAAGPRGARAADPEGRAGIPPAPGGEGPRRVDFALSRSTIGGDNPSYSNLCRKEGNYDKPGNPNRLFP
jgi:hypothetical protein